MLSHLVEQCSFLKPFGTGNVLKLRLFVYNKLQFISLPANGNSQMYDSAIFIEAVKAGGFEIYEEIDGIGLSHTLLKCANVLSVC